ncbi:MAG: NDP-sugar synthase [Actinobacteria bacterium]|nr:NDP-sugar synthase [Actinomycetota bacterium]
MTLSRPKQMLPIVGVPMIERVLTHLDRHGIDEAVLSLGYLPDAFMGAYPSGIVSGVQVVYAVEPEPRDTAGAIRFAADYAGIEETFVVVNGDVLTDLDLTRLIAFHRERGAQGTISLHPVPDPSSFGVVPTREDGSVVEFVEKPSRDEAPTNQINAGTYVLEPSVLERIPKGRRVSIERETFPHLAKDGRLFALSDDSYWLDTGTPAAYMQAHRDYLAGRRGSSEPVSGSRLVEGNVWISGSASLEGDVNGDCWLGEGASVAEGATVESSVVGPRSRVEAGAVVKNSILLEDVRVAPNASVDDSILGSGSTVGERCDVRGLSIVGAGVVLPSGTVTDGERIPG